MLQNVANTNNGNSTKSVVEKKKYEELEESIGRLEEKVSSNTAGIDGNRNSIESLEDRVSSVEGNTTFGEISTDKVTPITGGYVTVSGGIDTDSISAASIETDGLSVGGVSFSEVRESASSAYAAAERASSDVSFLSDKIDETNAAVRSLEDGLSVTVDTETVLARTITVENTVTADDIDADEARITAAEIDTETVRKHIAGGTLALPRAMSTPEDWFTVTVPNGVQATFAGTYIDEKDDELPYVITVNNNMVTYKLGAAKVLKDISFDRGSGNVRLDIRSTTDISYSQYGNSGIDVTITESGDAYTDWYYEPVKLTGIVTRGYWDQTSETIVSGILKAHTIMAEAEDFERLEVEDIYINNSINLPNEWDNEGAVITHSSGSVNDYVTKVSANGKEKPVWRSPTDNKSYPTPLRSNIDALITEESVANWNGTERHDETATTRETMTAAAFHDGFAAPTDRDYYIYANQKIYNTLRSGESVSLVNANGDVFGILDADTEYDFGHVTIEETEYSYPISHLRDGTVTHGDHTVEENLAVCDDLTVRKNAGVCGNLHAVDVIVSRDVAVHGDLYVAGTTTTTNEAQVSTSGDYIVTRENNGSVMSSTDYSGLVVNNYAKDDDNRPKLAALVADNTGTFRVSGASSSTETTYTDISLYNGRVYSGLSTATDVTASTSLDILTDVSAGELANVAVYNGQFYERAAENDWIGPISWDAVNKELTGLEITDETLINALEAVTPRLDFVYYERVKSSTISISTARPLATRGEEGDMDNCGMLRWNTSTNSMETVPNYTSCTDASGFTTANMVSPSGCYGVAVDPAGVCVWSDSSFTCITDSYVDTAGCICSDSTIKACKAFFGCTCDENRDTVVMESIPFDGFDLGIDGQTSCAARLTECITCCLSNKPAFFTGCNNNLVDAACINFCGTIVPICDLVVQRLDDNMRRDGQWIYRRKSNNESWCGTCSADGTFTLSAVTSKITMNNMNDCRGRVYHLTGTPNDGTGTLWWSCWSVGPYYHSGDGYDMIRAKNGMWAGDRGNVYWNEQCKPTGSNWCCEWYGTHVGGGGRCNIAPSWVNGCITASTTFGVDARAGSNGVAIGPWACAESYDIAVGPWARVYYNGASEDVWLDCTDEAHHPKNTYNIAIGHGSRILGCMGYICDNSNCGAKSHSNLAVGQDAIIMGACYQWDNTAIGHYAVIKGAAAGGSYNNTAVGAVSCVAPSCYTPGGTAIGAYSCSYCGATTIGYQAWSGKLQNYMARVVYSITGNNVRAGSMVITGQLMCLYKDVYCAVHNQVARVYGATSGWRIIGHGKAAAWIPGYGGVCLWDDRIIIDFCQSDWTKSCMYYSGGWRNVATGGAADTDRCVYMVSLSWALDTPYA